MIPEKQIENSILNYLRANGIFCWKAQSVGLFDPTKKIYRRSNNKHHIKGVSDILGIMPNGRFLAVEVKSEKGRATPEQLQFIENIKESGGIALLARSIDDLKNKLKTDFGIDLK